VNIQTKTAEQTIELGRKIGARLRGGECIELISDVGGGKTTLVRGIAEGAGSKNHVSSPTFTISKVYKTPKFDIVHFDFYRLQEAGLIENEIEEAVYEPSSVIIVEWSDIIQHVLPEDRLVIKVTSIDEHNREISLSAGSKISYLVDQIVS
jgi:tRNA threonylcarbamoyladenosine biosynthesis protein TsaE